MTATTGSPSQTEVLRDLDPPALRRRSGLARRVRLEILESPDRRRTQELAGASVVIGTARDNDVVLTDPTVSRYHLRLHLADSILVRDLESRNGTFLGELQIREALVPLGARLRVGRTILSLLDAEAFDAAAESAASVVRLDASLAGAAAAAAADPAGVPGAVPRAASPDEVVPYRVARSEAVAASSRITSRA